MTSNTEGIINISNNEIGSNKAKVMELIQDHVNDRTADQSQILRTACKGPSDAEEMLERQIMALKISHEEWVRRKDHETQLRQKLIMEAKRDLLETLVQKQEEEALRMQERS